MLESGPLRDAWYLTGPTASGKTAVAVQLAELVGDVEVLAMDSMTIYRGMDVGTAKPTLAERRDVPHRLLDMVDPGEGASVADYRGWALQEASAVWARRRRPLFVGGTPLYLKALLRGLFEGPGADPEVRERLEAEPGLHERLAKVDPISAARLHPNDRRRTVRALEVFELTGRPLSSWQVQHDRPAPWPVKVFALETDRAALHDRIDRRTVAMFAGGLLDEVERLEAGPWSPVPAQAAGYREARNLIARRCSLDEAIAATQLRTRQLAKRQATWFRGLAEVRPLSVGPDEAPEAIAQRLAREWRDD